MTVLACPFTDSVTGDTVVMYGTGMRDLFTVCFYSLVCIVVHAVIQEYLLDVSHIINHSNPITVCVCVCAASWKFLPGLIVWHDWLRMSIKGVAGFV